MKNYFVLLLICFSLPAFAQDCVSGLIRFTIVTGSDDLRGDGNHAYFTINLTDGTSWDEKLIGGGFGQNSTIVKEIRLDGDVALSEIRSITIRHNGSPRSNHPFDTYDNWDLQTIRIALIDNEGIERNIYNSVNDRRRSRFVLRFTGDTRNCTFFKQRS